MSQTKTKYDLLLEWMCEHKSYHRIVNVDRLNKQFEDYLADVGISDFSHRVKGKGNWCKYPLHTMKAGEFVVVTGLKNPGTISAAICAHNKKYGHDKQFTMRWLSDHDGVLWRTK